MKSLIQIPNKTEVFELFFKVLPYESSFMFYGVPFKVQATCKTSVEYLKRIYAYFVTNDDLASPQQMLIFEEGTEAHKTLVRELRLTREVYGDVLVVDWFGWGIVLTSKSLLNYYASKLIRLMVVERIQDKFITLHGASISGRNAGILLIGEAAAGKTSLSLKLIELGFKYCADDTSCIRKNDLICVPFPMPFIVRAILNTREPPLLELKGQEPDIKILDEPRWLVERWEAISSEFHPTHLIFLGTDRLYTGEFKALSASQSVLELLRNIVFPLGADISQMKNQEEDFDLVVNIVEQVQCFYVDTSNLALALHNILEVIVK